MEKKTKRIILGSITAFIACLLITVGILYYLIISPQFYPQGIAHIYIDEQDTADSVYHKVQSIAKAKTFTGFLWLAQLRDFPENIHTGHYTVLNGENAYHVFHRLYRGHQTPVNLVVGSVRTLDKLAQNIGKQLMLDSAEIASKLNDSLFINQLGYRQETLPCLFIPNTYEVYWNISAERLIQRLQNEHQRFWTAARLAKAEALGLSPCEVVTLASIVEEETNQQSEKPMVAGLYLNRLKKGMPLQADPTIKFAMQDFNLRRITQKHLATDSPYNTYKNAGLPPGPIRIPTPAGIDAVLNPAKHNYLYMCAKEDFSGSHNFATNLNAHMKNARKYWNALNKRKIFK